MAYRITHRC